MSNIRVNAYKETIESSILVSVGTLMHLNRISIIELSYSKLPNLSPNAASTLFVFSVLCMFAKLRTLWFRKLQRPYKFLLFFVEVSLILYATDILVRQFWLPCLKLLNFLCHYMGQYVKVVNENFLHYNVPIITQWLRNEAFYIARFMLAIVVFLVMLDTTGVVELVQAKLRHRHIINGFLKHNYEYLNKDEELLIMQALNNGEDEDASIESFEDSEDISSFDVSELPYPPQEDLLNPGYRVGSRRRRRKSLCKNKRSAKVNLGKCAKEYHC